MAYGISQTLNAARKPGTSTKKTTPPKPQLTPRPGGTQAVRGGTTQNVGVPITTRPTFAGAPPTPTPIASPTYQGSSLMQNASAMGQGTQNPSNLSAMSQMQGATLPGASAAGTSGGVTGPLTGFASAFTPDMLPYVYAQPELILKQLMENNGQSPLTGNSGLYTAATPYMDALMSILPLAFGGKGQPDPSSSINWLADQMGQGMQPGGQAIDLGGVLRALQDQLKNTSSATAQYFTGTGMSPLDQISKAKEVLYGAGSAGLAPQFQTALKNAINTASLNFMGKQTTGQQSGNFLPWFLNSSYTQGYK